MIDSTQIVKAVDLLRRSAPESTIIMFGSHARGSAGENSDLDFLVVKPKVVNRRKEIAQLLRVLEPYEIPVDIFVASQAFFQKWKDTPGTMLFDAAREGKIVHEP